MLLSPPPMTSIGWAGRAGLQGSLRAAPEGREALWGPRRDQVTLPVEGSRPAAPGPSLPTNKCFLPVNALLTCSRSPWTSVHHQLLNVLLLLLFHN